MARISRHNGPSVRVFETPATRLRRAGKLGPYEPKVETFEHPQPAGAEPTADVGAEPTAAQVRAWATEQGIDVNPKGKVPAELVDRYKAAHQPEPDAEAAEG